jgi:glucose-1-phosphate cytidylyltransferase
MVEIGGRPLLWHIMAWYAAHGFREFVIACGYKGEVIKQYFHDLFAHSADWTIDLATGERTVVRHQTPDWRVHMVDTGADTLTGGRLLRLGDSLGDGTFMVTYGDGLSDVDLKALVTFHRAHGRLATVTAVHPPARFGAMELDAGRVVRFSEKPQTEVGWINGGFFVFERPVLEYIDGPDTALERAPLERLAEAGELMAYQHAGFWQPMDTLREKRLLETLWQEGRAPWVARQ